MCHYYADSLYTKIFLQREDPCNKYVIFIEIDTTEMPTHCQLAKSYAFKSTKIRFDFKKPGHFTADFKILLKMYESHHITIKLHALENVSYQNEFNAIDFASCTPVVS